MKPYRILVTRSRDWPDRDRVWLELGNAAGTRPIKQEITIVHGAARGVDQMAHEWAHKYGATPEPHHAENHGPWPRCGPIRNWHMINLGADLCLAFISDCTSQRCHRPGPHPSHGATGCADLAERNGIETRRWTA